MHYRTFIIISCSLLSFVLYIFIHHTFFTQSVPATSAMLYKSIVIDAGHGGVDSGTTYNNIEEKNINLNISKYLKQFLSTGDYYVSTTRDEDISLDKFNSVSHSRHNRDLFQRVFIINSSNCEFFISLHVNSSTSSKASGSTVFYKKDSAESKLLAESIQNSLNTLTFNTYKPPANSISKGSFYILRESTKPGILVETGFMTNKTERNLLINPEYQKSIASKIFEGTEAYYMYRQ